MDFDKAAYIDFCEQRDDIPLFLQPWWLDAVTQPDDKEWQVLIARNKNGNIEAVMPFLYGSKWGMRYALTPQLTQYTGLWIAPKAGESTTQRLSREKNLQNDIIRQLETLKLGLFEVKFPLSYNYWSPFYWAGYQQQTRYTYRIDDLSDLGAVYARIDKVKRQHIEAAARNLEVRFDMKATDFYRLQCSQLSERGSRNVLSEHLATHLIDTARTRNQGFIVSIGEPSGVVHAAYFIPYDAHCAYNLIVAINPLYRASGASSLALWMAIKKASEVTKSFDFEGSMIEGVEHNNRQFGGVPVPYYTISKATKWLALMNLCRK